MPNKHIEDFRKAVTAGTPVEAVARVYGLSKGPGESDAELTSRLEMLLETAPTYSTETHPIKASYVSLNDDYSLTTVIEGRRLWESMYMSNWNPNPTAKYKRETVAKMLKRGEISEARAEELLREVADAE